MGLDGEEFLVYVTLCCWSDVKKRLLLIGERTDLEFVFIKLNRALEKSSSIAKRPPN